jgi:serine/threonine-protein kinase RsbW
MPVPSFSCRIPADLQEIALLSERIEAVMVKEGFSEGDILDTQLAVEETVTNIILHGYAENGGEITIVIQLDPDQITIELADQASPFDPLSLPEPDLEADIDERKIGGLGIFLTRKLMNAVMYRFEDGKNILTMVKKKSA